MSFVLVMFIYLCRNQLENHQREKHGVEDKALEDIDKLFDSVGKGALNEQVQQSTKKSDVLWCPENL